MISFVDWFNTGYSNRQVTSITSNSSAEQYPDNPWVPRWWDEWLPENIACPESGCHIPCRVGQSRGHCHVKQVVGAEVKSCTHISIVPLMLKFSRRSSQGLVACLPVSKLLLQNVQRTYFVLANPVHIRMCPPSVCIVTAMT